MILKGFKEKSNKKYIAKCAQSRVILSNAEKLQRVGVIVNSHEFSDPEWINRLTSLLKIKANDLKILALFNGKKNETSVYTDTFSEKELGWKGQFKSQSVKDFVANKFDLLINFYETDSLALQTISAATQAPLKVGLHNANPDINDLTIDITIKDKNIFKTELIKYLNILNKLSNE